MPYLGRPQALRTTSACALAALIISLLGAVALAQPVRVTEADRLLADDFTRQALAVIARQEQPDEAHRQAAGLLLELATELTPDDPERLRLYTEVSAMLGDPAAQASALGKYVRLRPSDDAAMMQLLLLRLGDTQTLDGRLAALERVLNAANAGARLSDPLRSRLAMLAAEASAELGDQGRYIRWLKEAAKLDPGNAPAAAATYEVIAGKTDNPKLVGAAAINWVKASPIDGRARLSLASVLVSQAAYLEAAQQFATAARFNEAGLLPWRAYRAWALSLGAAGEEAAALGLLQSLEEFLAQDAAARAEAEPGAAPVTDGLPAEIELVRLVLLGGAAADPEATDADAIRESYRKVGWEMTKAELGAGLAAADADQASLERAWLEAVFGPDYAQVGMVLDELPGDHPLRHRAEGWVALRSGEPEAARTAFERVPNDPFAMLGLARLTDPSTPEGDRLRRDLIRAHPESLAALIAARSLFVALGEPSPSPEGQTLLDLMKKTPMSVWRMDLVSSPWVQLQAKVKPTIGQALWPVEMEVSLRNAGPTPLALGPGQPLRPVVFLNIAVFQDGQIVGSLPTQVIDLGRRLTLAPGQRMVIGHRLDWGALGQVVAENPNENLSYAVSATLDPRVLPDGAVIMGPLGSSETMRALLVRGEAASDETVQRWLDAMSGGGERDEVVALIRLAMLSETYGDASPATVQRGRELLAERAAALDASRLALAVRYLDPAGSDTTTQRLLDLAKRSEEDVVRVAYLLGQVEQGDDPAVNTALRAGSPRLQRFAEAWRAVLDTPVAVSDALEGAGENPLGP